MKNNDLLIIVDAQNDFINGVLGSPEAEIAVENICELVKNWRGDIAFTYDTHDSNYLNTLEGNYLPVPHCIKNTQGWQLNKKIADTLQQKRLLEDIFVFKVEKDTFGSLNLPDRLKPRLYDTITIVGFCTDICVISNALILKATRPNTLMKVIADCCAGTAPQAHQAALTVMKSCQIEVIK